MYVKAYVYVYIYTYTNKLNRQIDESAKYIYRWMDGALSTSTSIWGRVAAWGDRPWSDMERLHACIRHLLTEPTTALCCLAAARPSDSQQQKSLGKMMREGFQPFFSSLSLSLSPALCCLSSLLVSVPLFLIVSLSVSLSRLHISIQFQVLRKANSKLALSELESCSDIAQLKEARVLLPIRSSAV